MRSRAPAAPSCGPVQQQLASYCAIPPSGDAGSSSGGDACIRDSSTDADAGSDADAGDDAGGGGTTCLPALACGSGGLTYEECTTTGRGGACTSIQYEVSNGTSFTCSSCSDCNSAIQQLDAYCAAENPTTTCTASSPCETSPLTYQTCTTSIGGACEAVYYQTSDSSRSSTARRAARLLDGPELPRRGNCTQHIAARDHVRLGERVRRWVAPRTSSAPPRRAEPANRSSTRRAPVRPSRAAHAAAAPSPSRASRRTAHR